MVPGITQRYVTAHDGTKIGYQVRGEGPAVVLANGLGGTHVAFRYLYEALASYAPQGEPVPLGYKTICWDYRGLYTTAAPADPRANTISHQVEDLMTILAAEGVGDFAIGGWSMGVQVAFETIKQHPARVRGLFAINGTYGRAFRSIVGARFIAQTIPTLLRLVKAQALLVGRATKLVAGSDALINTMKRMGLVSTTIDVEIFRAVAGGFQHIDWGIYSDLLARLDEHDAEDVLAQIRVPVTIVTGDKDLMTPPATAEHIHRAIPGSRLVVVKGGTHYTPVEYPAILVDELGRWLDRIPGWARAEQAA